MSISPRNKKRTRKCFGTTLAELPAGLWLIFIGIGMPVICLMLTTVRYLIFMEAARQAADVAAQAQVYITSTPSSQSSGVGQPGGVASATGAVTLAQNQAVATASIFSGLNVNPEDVNCWIVVTPLSTGNSSGASTVVGPNTPLTNPPDTSQNLYQLRVDITGRIQPIISMSLDPSMSIPGLNAPMVVKTSMTRVFENPSGLYQASASSGVGYGGGSSSSSSSGGMGMTTPTPQTSN